MDPVARRARYAKISTELVHLDDEALCGLVADRPGTGGSGNTRMVEVAGESVFVKSIPLTDLERDRMFSTRNHYGLPTFYQYGVGSLGFGAWRELVTHVTTTNWVLGEVLEAFPLTYHFRIVPRPGQSDPVGPSNVDDHVQNWNSSQAIRPYVTERAAGSHAALVFVEQVPHSLWEWLAAKPEDTDLVVRQLCETVSFLRAHGIVHFDAHFNNAVTDGERAYLVDFGMALDSRFDLTAHERAFQDRHSHYDYGGIVYSVGAQLAWWYESLPDAEQVSVRERLEVADDRSLIYPALVRGVERLGKAVHPALLDAVVRYRDIIEYMDGFFGRLRANPRKNTPYDDDRLRQLLRTAGVIDRSS